MRRNAGPGPVHQHSRLRAAAVWLVYAPALALFGFHAALFVGHGAGLVTFPYQVDYGEAPELNRALLLARGAQIYVDPTDPPFQMANYTPLYPAIVSLLVRFTGPDFWPGRAISFGATLGTAGLLALAARGLGAPWVGASLASVLWLAQHPVWRWGAYQRVDALAVSFELAGVALFCAGWVRRRRTATVWLSVALFLAAAFTRQTVAAGALACLAYLLFVWPRLALAAGAVTLAAGMGLVGLLLALTDGWFWWHTVEGNLNRWTWDIFHFYWGPWWALWRWAFWLAGATLFALGLARRSQVPALYLLAGAATALTMGKIGSNVNYLFQVCAALSLMCGLAPLAVEQLARRVRWAGALHLLAAGALSFGGWQLLLERRTEGTQYWTQPTAEESVAAHQAHARVVQLPGELLSEDMTFTVTTGRRLYLQPFEFTQLAEQGEWDPEPVLADVRRRRFSAVVLRFDLAGDPSWHGERLSRPVLNALRAAYTLDSVYGDYFIYRPQLD